MRLFLLFTVFMYYGALYSQSENSEYKLWENGAPGFEHLKNEKEQAKDWWVKNIHHPSITMFKAPDSISNGTSVIICPGGGHRALVYDAEGRDAALYLNSLGITAFVLKYRLAREENSPYDIALHAKEDALRALRTVRFNAEKWGIAPDKLGMLGFSAGGEVVSMVSYLDIEENKEAQDSIDRMNGRPDFQMLVYPGPLGIPDKIPSDAPPIFLVVANDDTCCSEPVVQLINGYRKANRPIEAHMYAKGGHAFNMGYRSELRTLGSWPQRMADWLFDNGYLKKN